MSLYPVQDGISLAGPGRHYLLFFPLGMRISAASGSIEFFPSVRRTDPIRPLRREIVASVTEEFGAHVRTPGTTVFVVEVTVGDSVAWTRNLAALVPLLGFAGSKNEVGSRPRATICAATCF
jgi:hypothetical protein